MNPSTAAIKRKEPVKSGSRNPSVQAFNPVREYLDRVTSLPPAPLLLTKLLTLFREQSYDLDQVVELIGYEPSLTAQLLRTCNSACFAGEQPTADIFDAVTRIGVYQVYCLVAAIYGSKTKSLPGADKGVDVRELWRHSVAVAVSASLVANEAGQNKASGFTAGLLHDIGKLVLASTEREVYGALTKKANDTGVSLSALERGVFVADHAELGGELLYRWGLPLDIVAAVRYHNNFLEAAPYEQLTAAVHVGDMISRQLFGRNSPASVQLTPSVGALGILELSPEDLPGLLTKSEAEMEKVKGMLEI
jgi:putative nucleotidyltransferase with HDIG domain